MTLLERLAAHVRDIRAEALQRDLRITAGELARVTHEADTRAAEAELERRLELLAREPRP